MSTVIYSGEVSSGLVADYSNTIIVSGGTVTDTTIDYGAMSVFIAGAQVRNTVMSGGTLFASAGRIENTLMDDGAYFSAMYHADITGTTVNRASGAFRASSVRDTIVNAGGSIGVYAGTFTNTTVVGGYFSLYNSGTEAYKTVVAGSDYERGYMSVGSATATETTIESGGYMKVSGGTAVDTVVNSSGGLLVSIGALASNTMINEGGSMSMEVGSADLVTVNSGGRFSAGYPWGYYGSSSGFGIGATNVKENGGAVYIGSGSSGTSRYDAEGGRWVYTYTYFPFPVEFASNTFSGLVYSDYRAGTVHSGTTAVDIKAIAGGLTVYSGGVVSGYVNTPTTWTSTYTYWDYTSHIDEETGEWVYESSLKTSDVDVTTVGGLTVVKGGTVTGLVAQALDPEYDDPYSDPSYLHFEIASGTVISGTVDGGVFATENGVLNDVSVKNVRLTYLEGATAANVSQYNGGAVVMSGAYASNLTFSGGSVEFSSGAVVDGVNTFAIPYTYVEYGMSDEEGNSEEIVIETSSGTSVLFLAGATVTNLNMDSWSHLHMQVAPNTVLNGTSGGVAIDLKDAHFDDATLGNTIVEVLGTTTGTDGNGNAVQIAGGTVSDLIILNGATVTVMEGGEAWNMVENGGALHLSDDWMEEPLGLYSIVSNTFSYGHLEGDVTVHKNTVALDNIMYGGNLQVFSGGVVSNFYTVAGGGKMNMYSIVLNEGAIVTNLDMDRYTQLPYHPGNIDIYGGVYLADARLTDYDGISLTVTPDTVFTNCSIDNIPFSVEDGVLSGFVANGEGWFSDSITISDGARIIDSYIDAWGEVRLENGASARNLTLANNYFDVNSGCYAENVTVGLPAVEIEEDGYSYTDYNSATAYVSGTLRDFTINEYSVVEVYDGGMATGVMRIGDGKLNVYAGGTVDFDVTDPSAQSVARLDDLRGLYATSPSSYPFSGGVDYTITVDGTSQAAGKYVLANHAYIGTNEYLYLNVVDTNGENYGFFEGWYTEVTMNDKTEIEFMSHFAGNAPSGFSYWLTANRIERDDGVIDFDLVFTVESEIAPTPWFAAPTVTADIATFTNQDVFLTVTFDEETTLREYSTDCTVWQAFEGDGISVSENNIYYFRGYNADGTESEIAGFQVSNIDFVAPTVAADLASAVDESTVTLSWTDSTDDYAGVKGFNVSYWLDGKLGVRTVFTPGTELVLEEMVTGTWNWTVTALDYAGNASETVTGGQFVVTNGYIPRLDLPDFLVGNFLSDAANSQMGTFDDSNAVTIYTNGAPWGNGLVLDPGWMLSGIGDFDADGRDDFLRINAEGYVVGEMTQADGTFAAQVLNFKSAGWDVLGVGDFNGNGSDDVLIANPTGASDTVGLLGYWESGVTWTLINGYSAEWECIATGDYNADGKCDMLWRNSFTGDDQQTYNAYCTWIVEDPVDWRMVSVANPAEWNFLCAGDFNGDGMNDIAMINDVGVVGIWGVENGWLSSWSILSAVDTSEWKLVGVGDFNADGTDDIAWCSNISGLAGYWQIEDKTLAGWSNLANLA